MTVKRVFLIILTVWAAVTVGLDLWHSWSQPQFQSRLELYQTNLVLQATELQETDPKVGSARKALVGDAPVKNATEQYQEFRQSAQKNLDRTQKLLSASSDGSRPLETTVVKADQLLTEVDLRIGLLQIRQGQTEAAQKTWATVIQQTDGQPRLEPLSKTAGALAGLWSDPPRLFPNAESLFKKNLEGWFRYRALSRLYELQQRQDAFKTLQAEEQLAAERAFNSLAIVGGVPVLGCLIGVGILLFLGAQWLIQRKQATLAVGSMASWSTPWDGETVWQVLIFGFFLMGQIVLPLAFGIVQQLVGLSPAGLDERAKAFYILMNYLLLAAGSVLVLYQSIKAYFPLPEGWFQVRLRGNWFWWGLGGYLAALPLVILISAINQKIWQGQGGSNPILPIALEGKDSVALSLFFITAAIAAPIFEELLFRGFLLPSVTRYFPMWGAIALSSLIFAVAHLSLSEVLPLTVLGMVLGFVYVRSRNLLSSMLLHSLWNSGTLLSLFVLGSGTQ